MLPVILRLAEADTTPAAAEMMGTSASEAIEGLATGAKAFGKQIAIEAKNQPDKSDATPESNNNQNISKESKNANKIEKDEATSDIKSSIINSIADQISILRKTVENYETMLFKREQSSEAADIENKIEYVDMSGDASKIDKTHKSKDKKSEGLVQKLLGALLFTVFAFLPPIMRFFKQSKQAISALPRKIIDSFSNIIHSISDVIKEYVVDPISKFFKVDIAAALDTMFIFIGDQIEAIMDVPKRLFNSMALGFNEFIISTIQLFVDFLSNNSLLQKLGITRDAVNTATSKLADLKVKRDQLQQESSDLEDRKAAREKTTISGTFAKQQAERQVQYEKEHPAKLEKTINIPKVQGMDDVKAMIKRHEGVRNQAYKDSVGKWTIGVGHLIGDGSSPGEYANRTLSDKEIDDLFQEDFAKHVKIAEKTPGWNLANESGKAAMIDLAFNMGAWWKKWPNTSKALEEGNFDAAADGLQNSKWYTQVGNRAKEIVGLIKSGKSSTNESTNSAIAEVPSGVGEQIGPNPKPKAATPEVAVVVPPASPTNGNAGGKKAISKPDPNQVQKMYALGLGMPGTT